MGHCPGCGVGLGYNELCRIPACPAFGLYGADADRAAAHAHPAARAVARAVAGGEARPGQVLGAGDDLSWQRTMTGARALAMLADGFADPPERRAMARERQQRRFAAADGVAGGNEYLQWRAARLEARGGWPEVLATRTSHARLSGAESEQAVFP